MVQKQKNRIITDPKIMVGKPVVKGTRITVELILRLLAHGMTEKEILENYPHIKKQDIQAVLEYAADTIQKKGAIPFSRPTQKYEYA